MTPDNASGDPVQYLIDNVILGGDLTDRPLTASAVAQVVHDFCVERFQPGTLNGGATLAGVSYDIALGEEGPFLVAAILTTAGDGEYRQALAVVDLTENRWIDTSSCKAAKGDLTDLVGVTEIDKDSFPTYLRPLFGDVAAL